MSFQIVWDKNNANVNFYGTLTIKDFLEANGLIYGNHRFDNMEYQIADFTDVQKIELSDEDVIIISTLELSAVQWNRHVKVAHVTKNQILKDLVHVYETKMKETNWSCKLFENLTDAKEWCAK